MRWARNVSRTEKRGGIYRNLVGKPEGKRPLGNHTRRWEGNIKMHPKEVGCGDWIGLIWLRLGSGGGHLSTR